MNNKLKNLKKIVAIFIILVMSLNSFATTPQYDGSTFITKSEFDSLMERFNKEIDTYQTMMNSKIDEAIAKYLAGMSDFSQGTSNILLSNWTEISAFGGVHAPTFRYPEVDIFCGGGQVNYYHWDSNKYHKLYTSTFYVRMTYAPSKTSSVYRPLFKSNKSEANQSASDNKRYWNGIATNYDEVYSINAALYQATGVDMPNVEGNYSKSYQFTNPANIVISNGYNSNLTTLSTVINPTVVWSSNGSTATITFDNKNLNTVTSVNLLNDSNGKSKIYEHIISYAGSSSWCLSNEGFTRTFRTHSSDGNRSATLLSNTSKTYKCSVDSVVSSTTSSNTSISGWSNSSRSIYGAYRGDMSTSFTTSSSIGIPHIGMLASDVNASNIYLTDEKINNPNGGTVTTPTLQQGFPLLYAEKDQEITWYPKFKTGKVSTNGSTWTNSTANRVKLLFSLGPFSDKIASANIIAVTGGEEVTTDGGVICEIGKSEEVKFTMPASGIVYAKWVPDTSDYDTANWINPLDLTACSTYKYTK